MIISYKTKTKDYSNVKTYKPIININNMLKLSKIKPMKYKNKMEMKDN